MLDILKMVLFGIVEGITEWLPISSTGHLIILEKWLPAKDIFVGGDAFWQFFLVAIQLGAILAVIVCFFNELNPFFGKSLEDKTRPKNKEEKKQILLLWAKVLIACLPAAVLGLLLDDWLDANLYRPEVVCVTLIVYGILFILIEIWNKKRTFKINDVKDLSFRTAFFIGCIQLLSLIPGTSRSGVTILGAMLLFCNRSVAAKFSFFLAIPVMFGASLLKGIKYMTSANAIATNDMLLLGVGTLVAFGISLLMIRFILSFVRKHDFKPFGIYRIVLGVVILALILCGYFG